MKQYIPLGEFYALCEVKASSTASGRRIAKLWEDIPGTMTIGKTKVVVVGFKLSAVTCLKRLSNQTTKISGGVRPCKATLN